MVLENDMLPDVKIMKGKEIQKTLSTYTRAAKTLYRHVQGAKGQTGGIATNGETSTKPYVFEDSRGRLTVIDGCTFGLGGQWGSPYSHGYRT